MLTEPTRRVLIISDRPLLASFLMNELQTLHIRLDFEAELCYSPLCSESRAMERLGAARIDLKNPTHVGRVIEEYNTVLSLHCGQIFPKELVESRPCINCHPGLNPFNRGWFPHVFSIVNGLPAGATLHLMTENIDQGPVIAQKSVAVGIAESSQEIYEKILAVERGLLRENLEGIITGQYSTCPVEDVGTYNTQADFRALCRLDLDNVATLREHLNLLRALSYGQFRNAWFDDGENGRCYVRLLLERDG
jgi:methionyl-tRNA formyltransferase